jgi:hypothetical protein
MDEFYDNPPAENYPTWLCQQFAIEHGDLEWIYPLKMVILHSYVTVYQRVKQNRGDFNYR